MGRPKRSWISEDVGSYHLISRVTGKEILLHDHEKEHFLKLLERFASGFFVKIHGFCILGTHFHILATNSEKEAHNATKDQLIQRYRLIYGENAEPPEGIHDHAGNFFPDDDGGVQRLRRRLGSISRFVQELKQTFSRWYNKNHDRRGYFWSDRFKSVITGIGEAQIVCSAYIDLNPVRANLVQRPEDYRWCGMGLQVRNPNRWKNLITPLSFVKVLNTGIEGCMKLSIFNPGIDEELRNEWYREFVYLSGGIIRPNKSNLHQDLVNSVISCHGRLGLGKSLSYRIKNISEGIAIGSYPLIADLQQRYNRKFIRPRSFLKGEQLYVTRILQC